LRCALLCAGNKFYFILFKMGSRALQRFEKYGCEDSGFRKTHAARRPERSGDKAGQPSWMPSGYTEALKGVGGWERKIVRELPNKIRPCASPTKAIQNPGLPALTDLTLDFVLPGFQR